MNIKRYFLGCIFALFLLAATPQPAAAQLPDAPTCFTDPTVPCPVPCNDPLSCFALLGQAGANEIDMFWWYWNNYMAWLWGQCWTILNFPGL
jgi:hypothetical protein